MVYLVERYLPGHDRDALLRSLERLHGVTEEMRGEGTPIRYLGSTIVPEDEACFCHFEAPSEGTVADANERAGLSFHRIVGALTPS